VSVEGEKWKHRGEAGAEDLQPAAVAIVADPLELGVPRTPAEWPLQPRSATSQMVR
jgi:hypothetical protein